MYQKKETYMRTAVIICLILYVPIVVVTLWVVICALIFHRMDLVPPFIRHWLER